MVVLITVVVVVVAALMAVLITPTLPRLPRSQQPPVRVPPGAVERTMVARKVVRIPPPPLPLRHPLRQLPMAVKRAGREERRAANDC